jgi:hypothetical protein
VLRRASDGHVDTILPSDVVKAGENVAAGTQLTWDVP